MHSICRFTWHALEHQICSKFTRGSRTATRPRPPELSDRIASMSATPLGLVRSSGLTLKPSTLCQSEGTEQSLGLVRLVSFLLGMIPVKADLYKLHKCFWLERFQDVILWNRTYLTEQQTISYRSSTTGLTSNSTYYTKQYLLL